VLDPLALSFREENLAQDSTDGSDNEEGHLLEVFEAMDALAMSGLGGGIDDEAEFDAFMEKMIDEHNTDTF
jgi:hypothetical protein